MSLSPGIIGAPYTPRRSRKASLRTCEKFTRFRSASSLSQCGMVSVLFTERLRISSLTMSEHAGRMHGERFAGHSEGFF